jgi:hypothetical protein
MVSRRDFGLKFNGVVFCAGRADPGIDLAKNMGFRARSACLRGTSWFDVRDAARELISDGGEGRYT